MAKTVMAILPGTYDHYREAGDVFQITEDRHFSRRWMQEVTEGEASMLRQTQGGHEGVHVVHTSAVDIAELEALKVKLAQAEAENTRLRGNLRPLPGGDEAGPRTALDVLAMANDSSIEFMTFKAAARKLLGNDTPSTKAEIVAALEDKATRPA